MTIVAYVPDLLDRSKVQGAAAGEVRFVRSASDLADAAARAEVDLVVVDLGRPGVLDVLPTVAATGVRTIGFGSHVDRALLAAARAAGCNKVMPRSEFFRRLPELLATDGA